MVRAERQEVEGPREGQLSPNPLGDDRRVEHPQSVHPNAQSEREEVYGAGSEVQKTSLSTKRPQAQSYHRYIHRHRKIYTVSDFFNLLKVFKKKHFIYIVEKKKFSN